MAEINKQFEAETPGPEPARNGAPDSGAGARPSVRRDWARLRRLLPPMLASWAAIVGGAYFLSMTVPAPGLPAPIEALISPLEANPFRACAAEGLRIIRGETVPLTVPGEPDLPSAPDIPNQMAPPIEQQQVPNAPAKASGLFIPSANAQEAQPNAPVDEKLQQFEQQQVQQQEQQIPENIIAASFAAMFDVSPAAGCGELGFGDLIDVAMSRTGDLAWVVNRYGLVYHSADGGKTWSRQTLPDLPEGGVLSAIAVDDAGQRLVAASRVDGALLQFYRSDDGGETWRLAPEMDYGARVPSASDPVLNEVTGLGIGVLGANGGNDEAYVLALVISLGPEAIPAVWRDGGKTWSIGYDQVEPEMIHGLRTHDYDTGSVDISASGLSTLPIGSWERWQDAQELRYSQLSRDEKDPAGALTSDLTPIIAYQIGAGGLSALAAAEDGVEVFGAEDTAILRGSARDESWSRIDLSTIAATSDFSLRAIDVADGNRAIMAVGRNALFVSQDGGATFFQPVLSQWPAPWFYLVLLSGPLYAFYLMRPGAPETRVIAADETKGLSDKALGLKDPDALNLRAYAEGLADLLRNAETKPPLVVGVTGPWGSGKSSVMQMLSELLAQRQMPIVWFNAWHHQSEEHLLASLLSNIRRQGIPGFWTRPGLRLRWRLMLQKLSPHEPIGGFLWSWFLLLLGLALLSGALALWIASAYDTAPPPAAASPEEEIDGVAFLQDLVCSEQPCKDLIQALANVLPGLEISALLTMLLGLIPLNRLKQVALITRNFDPAKLMTSVMPSNRNPRLDEQLSFRHGFGEELRATIAALAPYRLVIFIDDLDRCRPENVAAVLEAVNFVVSAADCYVVLGMDRAYVLRAIRQEFEKFIDMEKAERQDLSLGTPEEDKGRPRDFAEHYLEKLVNLIVSVPKMTPEGRAKLMESLASAPARSGDPAPAFDWWRWGRRTAAIAAMLAALLGPALYVATMSPPVALPPASESAPPDPQVAEQADASGAAEQSGSVRTIAPEIAEIAGVPGDAGFVQSSLGPALLVLSAIAAIVGIIWAAARAVAVPANLLIRDSGAFKTTLRSVEERLASFMTTPRRAKRFVNRLRLFGAMLRSGRDDLAPEREADLDRATVQAGALHALSRELLLARQVDSSAPEDAAARAVWEETRRQAEAAQKTYREALVALYRAIDNAGRPLVDALYWRFWQLSDGATLGDPAVVNVAKAASKAASGDGAGAAAGSDMLQPAELEDLPDFLPQIAAAAFQGPAAGPPLPANA